MPRANARPGATRRAWHQHDDRGAAVSGVRTILDGSEAVAHVETKVAECACVYPITPSTTMAASFQQAVAKGAANLWGTPLRFIELRPDYAGEMRTIPKKHTKVRHVTVSGDGPARVISHARPTKPPAKAIHARRAAALRAHGGKIPAATRARMDERSKAVRTKPTDRRARQRTTALRAGKRTPARAKKNRPAP